MPISNELIMQGLATAGMVIAVSWANYSKVGTEQHDDASGTDDTVSDSKDSATAETGAITDQPNMSDSDNNEDYPSEGVQTPRDQTTLLINAKGGASALPAPPAGYIFKKENEIQGQIESNEQIKKTAKEQKSNLKAKIDNNLKEIDENKNENISLSNENEYLESEKLAVERTKEAVDAGVGKVKDKVAKSQSFRNLPRRQQSFVLAAATAGEITAKYFNEELANNANAYLDNQQNRNDENINRNNNSITRKIKENKEAESSIRNLETEDEACKLYADELEIQQAELEEESGLNAIHSVLQSPKVATNRTSSNNIIKDESGGTDEPSNSDESSDVASQKQAPSLSQDSSDATQVHAFTNHAAEKKEEGQHLNQNNSTDNEGKDSNENDSASTGKIADNMDKMYSNIMGYD